MTPLRDAYSTRPEFSRPGLRQEPGRVRRVSLAQSATPPARGEGAGATGLPVVGALARELARAVIRRPVAALAGLGIAGMAGVITLNAVAYQARPHPSPLFGAKPRRVEAARQEPARQEAPRQEVARQEPRPAPRPEARASAPVERRAEAQPERSPERHAEAAPPVLLPPRRPPAAPARAPEAARSAEVSTGSVTSPSRPEPQETVAAVQRALIKLGHKDLKADGLIGPATRAAIERFERARGLTVTGEANARTLRALQAQARAAGG